MSWRCTSLIFTMSSGGSTLLRLSTNNRLSKFSREANPHDDAVAVFHGFRIGVCGNCDAVLHSKVTVRTFCSGSNPRAGHAVDVRNAAGPGTGHKVWQPDLF